MAIVRHLIGFSIALAWSTTLPAAVITESDTGVIFPDRDCSRIHSAEVVEVQLRPDEFDYLNALVAWEYACQMRDGRAWRLRERQTVFFPGLVYDSFERVWYWGQTPVARRIGWRQVDLLDDFFATTPFHIDEGLVISFRVQIERP